VYAPKPWEIPRNRCVTAMSDWSDHRAFGLFGVTENCATYVFSVSAARSIPTRASIKSDKLIGKHGTQAGIPPKELVEITFQRRRFDSPAGLYTIATKGTSATLDGRLRMTIVSRNLSATAGAVFTLSGLKYFLYLDDDMRPGPENFTFH